MEDRTGESDAPIVEFVCEDAHLRWRRSGSAAECAREHRARAVQRLGMDQARLSTSKRAVTPLQGRGRQMVGGVLNGVLVIPQANELTIALSLGAVHTPFEPSG